MLKSACSPFFARAHRRVVFLFRYIHRYYRRATPPIAESDTATLRRTPGTSSHMSAPQALVQNHHARRICFAAPRERVEGGFAQDLKTVCTLTATQTRRDADNSSHPEQHAAYERQTRQRPGMRAEMAVRGGAAAVRAERSIRYYDHPVYGIAGIVRTPAAQRPRPRPRRAQKPCTLYLLGQREIMLGPVGGGADAKCCGLIGCAVPCRAVAGLFCSASGRACSTACPLHARRGARPERLGWLEYHSGHIILLFLTYVSEQYVLRQELGDEGRDAWFLVFKVDGCARWLAAAHIPKRARELTTPETQGMISRTAVQPFRVAHEQGWVYMA
ncbi:hypothetical protein C8J57DRAFT_1257933 [Mycena rebaudengoi]|nr:hypothetical protein C8J57DRAFT_1257933 [Mycena rebaudengoi]